MEDPSRVKEWNPVNFIDCNLTKAKNGYRIADRYLSTSYYSLGGFGAATNRGLHPCIIENEPYEGIPIEIPQALPPVEKGDRSYNPEPLFVQFANCDTDEKILAFVQKYGLLKGENVFEITEPEKIIGPGPHMADKGTDIYARRLIGGIGDPLADCHIMRQDVSEAFDYWQAADERTKDFDFLQNKINFYDGNRRPYLPTPDQMETGTLPRAIKFDDFGNLKILIEGTDPLFDAIQWGDHMAAARLRTGMLINEARLKYPSSAFPWLRGSKNHSINFDLRMIPLTLIGLIWLQFAEVITGNKQIYSCLYCGKWFETAEPTKKPPWHATSCGTAARKLKAKLMPRILDLHEQNKTGEEIAIEIQMPRRGPLVDYWLTTDDPSKYSTQRKGKGKTKKEWNGDFKGC